MLHFSEQSGALDFGEVRRFNEAIDEALTARRVLDAENPPGDSGIVFCRARELFDSNYV